MFAALTQRGLLRPASREACLGALAATMSAPAR